MRLRTKVLLMLLVCVLLLLDVSHGALLRDVSSVEKSLRRAVLDQTLRLHLRKTDTHRVEFNNKSESSFDESP